MPTNLVAPGVYVIERDFSDYVASQASTSVGIVGTATRGTLNEPQLVTSAEQFVNQFDVPFVGAYGMYAALSYLREGNQCWYQRVARRFAEATAPSDATSIKDGTAVKVVSAVGLAVDDYLLIAEDAKLSSMVKITNIVTNTLTVSPALADSYSIEAVISVSEPVGAVKAEALSVLRDATGTANKAVIFKAASEGTWADYGSRMGLEVIIEDGGQFSNIDPTTNLPFKNTEGVNLQGVLPSGSSVDTMHELLSLDTASIRDGQVRGVNDSRRSYRVTAIAFATPNVTVTCGDLPANYFSAGQPGAALVTRLSGLSVRIQGATAAANNGTFTVSAPTNFTGNTIQFPNPTGVAQASSTAATVTLLGSDPTALMWRCTSATARSWEAVGVETKRVRVLYAGRQVETFDNLIGYDPESPNYWDTVIGTEAVPVSRYISVQYLPAGASKGVQPMSTYQRVKFPNNQRVLFGNDFAYGGTSWSPIGGENGSAVTADEYVGMTTGNVSSGLQAYRHKEQFDVDFIATPGVSDPMVVQEMIAIAEERTDCVALVDPPIGLSLQELIDWHNGTGEYSGDHAAFVSSFGALYWPWLQHGDPYTGRNLWLPPSTFVLPVFAYNDRVGQPWYAAAGIQRGLVRNAIKTEYVLTQGEITEMYGPGNGNAVNPIAVFPKDGIVVYGNRTLQRVPTALDRINVRRLTCFIEKVISASCRRLVFEQNDEVLWAQFVGLAEPTMKSLQGQRALEWFKVVCNSTTNPPEARNNNEMHARVLFIPTKSAEKIILEFSLFASGADVSTLVQELTATDNNLFNQ